MTEACRDLLEVQTAADSYGGGIFGTGAGQLPFAANSAPSIGARWAHRLFNRRYLEESISREVARVARDGTQLGIIMFDLDHFKRVNDTYGHDMGDAVLRQIGNLLLNTYATKIFRAVMAARSLRLFCLARIWKPAARRAEELRQLNCVDDGSVGWSNYW